MYAITTSTFVEYIINKSHDVRVCIHTCLTKFAGQFYLLGYHLIDSNKKKESRKNDATEIHLGDVVALVVVVVVVLVIDTRSRAV